jgi:hypothetical protein
MRLNQRMEYDEARERLTNRELVWHYTSLDTLAKILESNYLLATEVSFQNDIRETETADNAFDAVLHQMAQDPTTSDFARRVQNRLQNIDSGAAYGPDGAELAFLERSRFILCASREPDSLYAWRTYGGGNVSCAIGLDPTAPLGVVHTLRRRTSLNVQGWVAVMYSPEEAEAFARERLNTIHRRWESITRDGEERIALDMLFEIDYEDIPRVRSELRARAKDAAFVDEHELRVTVHGVEPQMITTTPSSMGPRPHVRLASALDWGQPVESATKQGKLPIRAIRLGPNAPASAEDSVRWLLLSKGYLLGAGQVADEEGYALHADWSRTVLITKSERPYRTT